MTPNIRIGLFAAAILCVLPGFVHVALHMPPFGDHPMPYGEAINRAAPEQRHVSNVVSALNFDYRAIDTLGEEFILLCAVTGVTVLLRGSRGEQTSARPGRVDDRPILPPSEAVTLISRIGGVLTIVLGLYVALHAMVTPGGGFQGAVIIASGFLLVYLGEGYPGWRQVIRSEVCDAVEAAGAALYAASGFAGMAIGLPYLTNFLPLGSFGSVSSGGLMIVINIGVTLAVAGGFGVLFLEFLEETRVDPDAGE